ncbi:hypothetical protein FBEOM_8063 [Fusarium beomiforme]|uniref:BZIP domain-containing protein n=1 Tax=Fusarium beomiforme TaxID=44412 RepID=A0A9P5AG44_9HYPO|nr:hypothetical protein FBEOM_8063 [Fusarium beomiforme]
MEHTATLTGQPYDLSMIGNLNAEPHLWDQTYFAANGANYQYDISETGEFIPRFFDGPTSGEWAESLSSQESSIPRRASELACFESSPSNPEYFPSPPSKEPEAKKCRLSQDEGNMLSLSQRRSAKKPRAEATVEGVYSNTEQPSTTKKANSKDNAYIRKIRERNKRAANKVRVKKRETEKTLQSTEKDLEETNHKLTAYVKELTLQIHDLKMNLLQHVGCNCVLIHEYISNEANRYIQDRSGEAAARKAETSDS